MAAALAPFPCTPLVRVVSGAVVSGGEGQMARKVMSYPTPTGLPWASSSACLLASDPQIGHKLDIIVSIKNSEPTKHSVSVLVPSPYPRGFPILPLLW